MIKKVISAVALGCLTLQSTGAGHAKGFYNQGFYVGAEIGGSKSENSGDVDRTVGTTVFNRYDLKKSKTGFVGGLFAGFQHFTDDGFMFGVEGAISFDQ